MYINMYKKAERIQKSLKMLDVKNWEHHHKGHIRDNSRPRDGALLARSLGGVRQIRINRRALLGCGVGNPDSHGHADEGDDRGIEFKLLPSP
jgi:hypothetical protein